MSTSIQARQFFKTEGLSAAPPVMTPANQHTGSSHHPAWQPADADVIHAVTTGAGLRMVYQPQHDLDTMRMTGAEAQLRWSHSLHGNVSLSVLALAVNRLKLHTLLFNFIVTQAIDVLCRHRFDPNMTVTVQASAHTVCAAGIATLLCNRMSRAGLAPRLLKIELREDLALIAEPRLLACLDALRQQGFPLSLDVIGGGPASLDLLSKMPFDEVKIDATYIDYQHEHAAAIASSILDLALMLRLKLLAQGIDNGAMISPLRYIGCGTGQGDAFGSLMEQEDFLKKMSNTAL